MSPRQKQSPYRSTRISFKAEELQQYEDRQVFETRQAEDSFACQIYEQASAFKQRVLNKVDDNCEQAKEWIELARLKHEEDRKEQERKKERQHQDRQKIENTLKYLEFLERAENQNRPMKARKDMQQNKTM